MITFNKNRLLLQFHITGRCNLSCKHCYRTEGNIETLTFDDIKRVIEQFLELKSKYNDYYKIDKRAHINITGGEPFFRSDIKEILYLLYKHRDDFSYGVLSNGSFIDDEMIDVLTQTNVSFVQLSIDGDKETHDNLRAKGDYERVFSTAAMLEKKGIRTMISFTATKENYKHLPLVARECRKRKISKLWSDRLVPIGKGENLSSLKITAADMPDYIDTLKKAKGGYLVSKLFPKTEVSLNRALQFLNTDGCLYSCSAGISLITVDEFGRIMPCRRMPIYCNDVFNSTLSQVYFENKTFLELQSLCIPKECAGCEFQLYCSGGAKCQSFAEYGDYKKADPACYLKNTLVKKSYSNQRGIL